MTEVVLCRRNQRKDIQGKEKAKEGQVLSCNLCGALIVQIAAK